MDWSEGNLSWRMRIALFILWPVIAAFLAAALALVLVLAWPFCLIPVRRTTPNEST